MTPSDPLACAIKDVASAQKTTFATTQAVWRFLNNARITFSQLNDPIIAFAREGIASSPHSYALVIHDGSGLQFQSHHKKQNRLQMSHGKDIGYELQSSLLVDAASGLPVAPLAQTLTDSAGCHSTLKDDTSAPQTHMDALTTDITRLEALDIGKTLVHIIDREGDSIAYMWELSVQGLRWLIRGKEGHRVQYKGETQKLGEVADGLEFTVRAEVDYKGRKAGLAISEAPVIITRVARPKRSDKETGRRIKAQPGHSLTVRLVVAQLSDNEGRVLGRWTLLTNVEDKLCGEEGRSSIIGAGALSRFLS